MDNNNITVQANLDTTQLKKDLEKFKGEINLTANTKEMQKQIDTTLKNASKNASISFKCNATGLNTISSQVGNAKSQIQGLQREFSALPSNLDLNVSVNSSGLQQYTAQLEQCIKLSKELSSISLQSEFFSKLNSTANNHTNNTSSGGVSSAGESFSNVLSSVKTAIPLLNTVFNLPGSYKNFSTVLSKSFD